MGAIPGPSMFSESTFLLNCLYPDANDPGHHISPPQKKKILQKEFVETNKNYLNQTKGVEICLN